MFVFLLVPRKNDLHAPMSALSTVAEPPMQSSDEEEMLTAAEAGGGVQDVKPDLHPSESLKVKH